MRLQTPHSIITTNTNKNEQVPRSFPVTGWPHVRLAGQKNALNQTCADENSMANLCLFFSVTNTSADLSTATALAGVIPKRAAASCYFASASLRKQTAPPRTLAISKRLPARWTHSSPSRIPPPRSAPCREGPASSSRRDTFRRIPKGESERRALVPKLFATARSPHCALSRCRRRPVVRR